VTRVMFVSIVISVAVLAIAIILLAGVKVTRVVATAKATRVIEITGRLSLMMVTTNYKGNSRERGPR